MKKLITAIFVLSLSTASLAEEDHSHGHQASGGQAGMTLNEGKKWKSDETLQKNMVQMHKQFNVLNKLVESKRAKDGDYKTMVEVMDKSIADIFKNCKLEPKADATLHVVLTELMSAKDKMKNQKTSIEGLTQARKGFNLFHEYFQ
ncbi:MAG: hypothetical protein BroJett040_20080 [Oligoflexia bacterium]|nr:MAG: hypothetical protein BroJett040_20080 [Oligoflexia bacterium]